MPDVQISGRTVTIERFEVVKGTRVATLLNKLQQEVPEVSRSWAEFQREYAEKYPTNLTRIQAIAQFGLDIPDDEWERAGQMFPVPGKPNSYEVFFHMAPLVYERAEKLTFRLLGLVAMPNDVVKRYVKEGVIWERVDEYVEEVIATAYIDEIMELAVTAAEVIDQQILAKGRSLAERAGNVARLLGIKTTTSSETSPMLNDAPVQPTTVSVSSSPASSDGTPTESSPSRGTSSTPSRTSSTPSMTSS